MSTIRPDFHTSLVTRLIEDIYYQRSNYFYYLGKIDTWNVGDEPPTPPINSSLQDSLIRDNILYMKRVTGNEVSLVTTSYEWESGTVFAQWDHTLEMQGENFYCITDDNNVYKCLSNNNGAPSIVKPTSISLFPFTTADGYLWKYMYNVPVFKRVKFLSRNHLPVQKALSDSFYNKGAVEDVAVTDGGSGYTDLPLTSVTVTGPTVGGGATAKVASVGSLGQITAITILTAGTGYTSGANVSVTTAGGSGADIDIIANGSGVVTGFTINSGGIGYEVDDVVNITVGGAVIVPVVSHTNGEIVDVKIISGGAGYAVAPTLTVVQSPATGTGKYGHATALMTAVVYQGSIVEVLVSDPGQDYPFDTSTTITVSGDGEGAAFSPVIYNGSVIDVVVENTGTNYSYIQLDVVGAGTGARLTAILAASDFLSDQSLVEQTAIRGAIYNAVVTVPGDNYSEATTISFSGDGTGAQGYPVIVDGTISRIVMTSYGQNYTYANITITDPNRPVPNSFTNAAAYAILPPANGHGFDAPAELYADTLSIYTLLQGDFELNLLAQDYRQYGLIKDPVDLLTNKRVSTTTNIIIFKVNLASVGSLAPDDVLINNNKRYRIVAIDGTQVELQQLNSIFTQPAGSFYKEGVPAVLYTIAQVVSVPTVNKYSGSLLYVTNNAPFTPTDEQSIAIRTYIKL